MQNFKALHLQAHEAGMAAGEAAKPVAMIVGTAVGLTNEIDRTQPVYHVADGVCGFAWVKFAGNTPFGRWAKKAGIAKAAYPTGLMIWVHQFNQSMQRKEAYAAAYARVLREAGVQAYADSRMD
jgi:hypothetical protein